MIVLGLGRQGMSLVRHFAGRGDDVIVSDLRRPEAFNAELEALNGISVTYVFGGHPQTLLDGADLLCLSGGVPADLPLAQQARRQGIPVSNDSQIFLAESPARTIGVTGSAGKTTTTTLIGLIAESAYSGGEQRAWVGGNIGRPLLEDLGRMKPQDLVVIELSSFQLELMSTSPNVAVVLNVTPNHLDRHGDFGAYREAKAKILTYQSAGDVAVLGWDDPEAWSLRERVRGRLLGFGWGDGEGADGVGIKDDAFWLKQGSETTKVAAIGDVELRGQHNLLNTAAAFAAAAGAGLVPEGFRNALAGFTGVPHRLEFVRRVAGAAWYNDSIATSPERAIAALRSFEEPIVLLAGGRDKGLPWDAFIDEATRRVEHLVLFGEAAEVIARAAAAEAAPAGQLSLEVVPDLDSAVKAAVRRAEPGRVVLLSPGGTSFDAFVDFEARGDRFKEMVHGL